MNELDCYDLLTLRLGAVFTMSDGEGSDCVLYVKSGNSEDDILVEPLAEPGEPRRLGIAEMDAVSRRSTKYRVFDTSELIALSDWLRDLCAVPVVKATQ